LEIELIVDIFELWVPYFDAGIEDRGEWLVQIEIDITLIIEQYKIMFECQPDPLFECRHLHD
jgi:hypothetical protein